MAGAILLSCFRKPELKIITSEEPNGGTKSLVCWKAERRRMHHILQTVKPGRDKSVVAVTFFSQFLIPNFREILFVTMS